MFYYYTIIKETTNINYTEVTHLNINKTSIAVKADLSVNCK